MMRSALLVMLSVTPLIYLGSCSGDEFSTGVAADAGTDAPAAGGGGHAGAGGSGGATGTGGSGAGTHPGGAGGSATGGAGGTTAGGAGGTAVGGYGGTAVGGAAGFAGEPECKGKNPGWYCGGEVGSDPLWVFHCNAGIADYFTQCTTSKCDSSIGPGLSQCLGCSNSPGDPCKNGGECCSNTCVSGQCCSGLGHGPAGTSCAAGAMCCSGVCNQTCCNFGEPC